MAIDLKDVSFSYPGGFEANKHLTLHIDDGERVAIVGQNGAGKTTAVKLMNGLNKPSEGDVLVDGMNTRGHTTAEVSKVVGYVFQNPDDQIFNQTVGDEIRYMPNYYGLSEGETKMRVDEAVELTGVGEYMDVNPLDIPLSIRKFVAIAAILVTEPKYLILDEPTAGQDLKGTQTLERLMDYLGKKGMGVITITHDMEFVARNFDRVVAMAHGNIIADASARQIFWDEDVVEESRISKPQIGEVAKQLGLPGQVLFRDELVRAVQ